jgi:hypothetical protein
MKLAGILLNKRSIFILLAMINVSALMAMGKADKADKPDFVLVNDTGLTITEIQIIPPKGKNLARFSNIKLKDEESFKVLLPAELREVENFDVTIIAGDKTIRSKGKIEIAKNQDIPPAFDMQIKKGFTKGKYVGGASGAIVGVSGLGAGAAALSAGIITLGQAAGAAAITEALVAIGGTMVGGIAVVAAIPVGLAAVGYTVGTLLASEKVVLTPIPRN